MPLSERIREDIEDRIEGSTFLNPQEKAHLLRTILPIVNKIKNKFIKIIEADIASSTPKFNKEHSLGNLINVIFMSLDTKDQSFLMSIAGKRQFDTLYKPILEFNLDDHYRGVKDYYPSSTNSPPQPLDKYIEGVLRALISRIDSLQSTLLSLNSKIKSDRKMAERYMRNDLAAANQATLNRVKLNVEQLTSRSNTRRRSRSGSRSGSGSGATATATPPVVTRATSAHRSLPRSHSNANSTLSPSRSRSRRQREYVFHPVLAAPEPLEELYTPAQLRARAAAAEGIQFAKTRKNAASRERRSRERRAAESHEKKAAQNEENYLAVLRNTGKPAINRVNPDEPPTF